MTVTDELLAELDRLDLGDGQVHAADGAGAVVHRRHDDMVFAEEPLEDALRLAVERVDHRLDAVVEGGEIGCGALERPLLVADEGEFLDLVEVVDDAAHQLTFGHGGDFVHDKLFFLAAIINPRPLEVNRKPLWGDRWMCVRKVTGK